MTPEELSIVSDTLRTIGMIFVAIVALDTSLHVETARTLSDPTQRSMRRKRHFGLVGLGLLTIGFLVDVYTLIKF